ncbi:MAG: twin-arginine translocase TatA/TatE family subunit [Pseudomonadota bacterium]
MEWSGPELILLFVIALVVLGPERMAQVAKKLGQFVGYARRMSRNLQVQLEDELEMQQIRDSLPNKVDLKKELGVDKLEDEVNALNKAHNDTDQQSDDEPDDFDTDDDDDTGIAAPTTTNSDAERVAEMTGLTPEPATTDATSKTANS